MLDELPTELARALGDAFWQSGADGLAVLESGRVVRVNERLAGWLVGSGDLGGLVGDELAAYVASVADETLWRAVLAGTASGPVALQLGSPAAPSQLEARSTPLAQGVLLRLQDVSRLRRAQDELRQKRAALEESLNGYDIVDVSGRITYANQAYLRMWGYESLKEVLGVSPAEHCVDPETPRRIIAELEARGHTTLEFEAKRKDGSTFDALMSAQVARDEHGQKIYVGTSLDISEVKRLRDEIDRAQRVEATGALAASLAHDFNNMLSPILGFTELQLNREGLSDSERSDLEQVMRAAESLRDLTAQLLAFSRRQVCDPAPTDLRAVLRGLKPTLARMVREDIDMVVHLGQAPCHVLADSTQLQQVVFNLVLNAQDAMPGGGKLTIEVGLREIDEELGLEVHGIRAGRYGELVVSDSGTGIDEETRQRVFEPFFTTKGRFGTGLGLASVHGIVQQHGGDVLVYSELGVGTTFKAYFPLTDSEVGAPASPAPPEPVSGTGSVLLVEDNELVLQVARSILERSGYRVHAAATGGAALQWLRDGDPELDLLLTDVIMPDMNGREVAEAARRGRPGLRVLFMSGYTDNVIAHHGILDAGIQYLAKPFSASDLLRRVAETMAEGAPTGRRLG